MIVLFIFEFVEGNTVTRLYFMRLRRLTNEALIHGSVTPELIHLGKNRFRPSVIFWTFRCSWSLCRSA